MSQVARPLGYKPGNGLTISKFKRGAPARRLGICKLGLVETLVNHDYSQHDEMDYHEEQDQGGCRYRHHRQRSRQDDE
jgi:hypothetical protein